MNWFKGFGQRSQQSAKTNRQSPKRRIKTFIPERMCTPSAGVDGLDFDIDFGFPPVIGDPPLHPDLPDFPGHDFDLHIPPVPSDPISPFESGYFTVGCTGQVGVDFLFDGGLYKGELAVFSLDGMDQFELGSAAFMQEAARRALSGTELGHIVIADQLEGAKFSGSLGADLNYNQGDYWGVKTFQMRPGDTVGFMLVPDGKVQEVFNNPTIGDNKTPLFSLATANPNDAFHVGQIVDVTGDGNTFVLEDLRFDTESDKDYNDIVFQVRGAVGTAPTMDQLIADGVMNPHQDWRTSDLGHALVAYANAYVPDAPIDVPVVDVPQANQPLIGIIDTGVAANNPDIDYSHLVLGHDYVSGDANPLLAPGEGNEHGTHILGMIGATQHNSIGIDGINDDAPIWVGRAIGSGHWADSLTDFVNHAINSHQHNAVVNLSLDLTQINPDGSVTTRYELTPAEWTALEYARQHNVLVVAAAGNDGGVMSVLGQASQMFDNIITVGSAEWNPNADFNASITTAVDRADYSSYGHGLDIMAFGSAISTVGSGLGMMTGTSVATAQVTGAISLIWAANPALSYAQIKEILKLTATDLQSPGYDLESGAGLLNVAAAIALAKTTAPEPQVTPAIPAPTTWGGAGVVTPIERAAADEFLGRYYEWDWYTIRSGDTLSAIALSTMGNGTAPYYNFIAQKNGIANPNLIFPNWPILIPRLVTAPPPPPPTPPTPVSNRTPYVIKKGDTLWAIAQSRLGNGTQWTTISKDAAGTQFFTSAEAVRLQIGQVVYLPVSWQLPTTPPVSPPPPTPITPPSQNQVSIDQFISWAKGQFSISRLDGGLRGQCVTLIARYIQEVFLPVNERSKSRAFGNGKDTARFVASLFPRDFEPVTTSGLPKRGAVISFPGIGIVNGISYGHVAIVVESRQLPSGQRQVRIIDSNGDGKAPNTTVKEYSYWINIPDGRSQGYGNNIYWTNPR